MKRKYYSLYGRILPNHALHNTFKSIKSNKGIFDKKFSMFDRNFETEIYSFYNENIETIYSSRAKEPKK